MLQLWLSRFCPVQLLPPYFPGMQSRVLLWVPLPQDLEQWFHSCQISQEASTANHKICMGWAWVGFSSCLLSCSDNNYLITTTTDYSAGRLVHKNVPWALNVNCHAGGKSVGRVLRLCESLSMEILVSCNSIFQCGKTRRFQWTFTLLRLTWNVLDN